MWGITQQSFIFIVMIFTTIEEILQEATQRSDNMKWKFFLQEFFRQSQVSLKNSVSLSSRAFCLNLLLNLRQHFEILCRLCTELSWSRGYWRMSVNSTGCFVSCTKVGTFNTPQLVCGNNILTVNWLTAASQFLG